MCHIFWPKGKYWNSHIFKNCTVCWLYGTRWFKYDQDDLCVNKSQFVPVIFEPPCINIPKPAVQYSVACCWQKRLYALSQGQTLKTSKPLMAGLVISSNDTVSYTKSIRNVRMERLLNVTEGYNPKNIYNADETGLFLELSPNKRMSLKHDPWNGQTNSKERIMAVFACNADGTD